MMSWRRSSHVLAQVCRDILESGALVVHAHQVLLDTRTF
ncbi:hypothetical protein PATSB16_14200 [Pandoraea thiooxydans]|nr:hypothetical protein PATSB16_14200 [Pandoraea thiooxydans]